MKPCMRLGSTTTTAATAAAAAIHVVSSATARRVLCRHVSPCMALSTHWKVYCHATRSSSTSSTTRWLSQQGPTQQKFIPSSTSDELSTSRARVSTIVESDANRNGNSDDQIRPLFLSHVKFDDPSSCLDVLNDPETAADVIAGIDVRHSGSAAAQQMNNLSPGRVDAYQHLRTHAPLLLAEVTNDGLAALCIEAASEGLSEFVEQILSDFAIPTVTSPYGHKLAVMRESGGVFRAPAGSTRRFHALQHLLSACTNNLDLSVSQHHPQSWKQVRRLTPRISTNALKGVSILLMKDLAVIASRSLVAISALLSRLHPAIARWLLIVVVKNGDVTLATLANALWQRVEVASFPGCDFPSPSEASHLCQYYLSLDSLPGENVALNLLPPSAETIGHTSGIPASLSIATRISGALIQAHPAMLSDDTLDACNEWIERLTKQLNQYDMQELRRTQYLMRLRVKSVMAFATSHSELFSSAAGWLASIQTDLEDISVRFGDDVVYLFLLTPVRSALRSACSTREKAQKAAKLVTTYLPLLIEASVQYRHSSDTLWLREFCERLISWGDTRQALQIVLRTSEMVFDLGRLRSDIGYMLGGDNIVAIARWLSVARDYGGLVRFLRSVGFLEEPGFVVTSAAMHLLTPTQCASLISVCAQGRLPSVAMSLYNHIVQFEGDRVRDRGSAEKQLKILMAPQSRYVTAYERNRSVSTDYAAPVTQSSECMAKLIDMVTAFPLPAKARTEGDEGDITPARPFFAQEFKRQEAEKESVSTSLSNAEQFAYHVLFTFMHAKPFSTWRYTDLVHLAQALFRLGHKTEAFRCLADIPFRKAAYSSMSFAVLARGMAQTNLTKSLERLEEWSKIQYMQEYIDDSVLAPVVTEALISEQPYLALRALEMAKERGLTEKTSVRSMALIIFTLLAPSAKRDELLKIVQLPTSAMHDEQKGNEDDVDADDARNGYDSVWQPETSLRRAYIGDIGRTWKFVRTAIERDGWRADPRLLRWIMLRLVDASNSYHRRGDHAVSSTYAHAAARLLQTSGRQREWVSHSAAIAILSTFRVSVPPKTSESMQAQYRDRVINELDRVVTILRWVRFYYIEGRLTHQDEAKTLLLGDSPDDMVRALTLTRESLAEKIAQPDDNDDYVNSATPRPNKLPVQTYRVLITTYLRLGDALGAANVMCWARDEAHLTMRDLEQGFSSKKKDRLWCDVLHEAATSVALRGSLDHAGQALSWLSGVEEVPKVKSWWQAPVWLSHQTSEAQGCKTPELDDDDE